MKVAELIELLGQFDRDLEVTTYDGNPGDVQMDITDAEELTEEGKVVLYLED